MSAMQQDSTSGIGEALASPADPSSDPGPGERSGLSSRVAEEILSGTEDFGAELYGSETTADDDGTVDGGRGAPIDLRAVEIDDPSRAVGDDPANPIHGSMAAEFEAR